MVDRGHESPMDFQWEGSGPGDPNSPFRLSTVGGSFTNDSQARKINQPLFQSSAIKAPLSPPASQFVFSTPYNQTPHTPHSIRPPPPQPIFRTPSFTTPRYSFNTPSRDSDIFSEGTPGTPDVDSEAPTPEAPWTGRLETRGAGNRVTSTTPSRITGRGELRRGLFYDSSTTKVRRRRQPQSSRDFGTPGTGIFEDEEDEEEEGNHPYSNAEDSFGPTDPPASKSWGRTAQSAAASWVATHRELPLIASHYLQVFFNLFLLTLILYALLCFYLTIRRDVDQKVREYSEAILADMSLCSRDYVENRCMPDMRVPAMETKCNAWEKCMGRDPSQVGRARVSAETFAEIINSFIEPISYKTMFFVLLVVFGGLFISNTAFGFYRSKPPAPYMPAPPPPPPPTPSHWERQAQQQLYYESLPRSPAPSTPARMVGYGGSRALGRMAGRENVRGKEGMWR